MSAIRQITQRQASYRKAEHAIRSCATCAMFHPNKRRDLPGTCDLVVGPIRPRFTCRYWEPDPQLVKMSMELPPSRARKPHVRVYVYNAGGLMLVLRRREGHVAAGNAPGTFEAVQGGIKDGEDPADAAKREVREEVGYYADDIARWRRISTYTFECHLKEGVRQPDITHNPDKEHDWWGWRPPELALAWMGRKLAKQGEDVPSADDLLEVALRDLAGWKGLGEDLGPLLGEAASEGVLDGFAELGVDDDASFKLANEDAVSFASDRAAELVGRRREGEALTLVDAPPPWAITEATRQSVRSIVTQAVDAGWSVDRLRQAVLDSYAFSPARAQVIARTELAIAHTAGNLEAWRRSGVVLGKRVILADDHDDDDDCDVNAAAGVIPIDSSFPSGDDGPPFHPNCKCVVVPVMQDEASAAGEGE